jgi:AcrR family transcriptional regulator
MTVVAPSPAAVEPTASGRPGKNDRCDDIVAIAKRAFLEFGYAVTSMSCIAAQVGRSKATLYNYFRTKEFLRRSPASWRGTQHRSTACAVAPLVPRRYQQMHATRTDQVPTEIPTAGPDASMHPRTGTVNKTADWLVF